MLFHFVHVFVIGRSCSYKPQLSAKYFEKYLGVFCKLKVDSVLHICHCCTEMVPMTGMEGVVPRTHLRYIQDYLHDAGYM